MCCVQDVFKLYVSSLVLPAVILMPYAAVTLMPYAVVTLMPYAVVTLMPYAVKAMHFRHTPCSVALRLLDKLVHAAPLGLPTVMLVCGGGSEARMDKQSIK